MKYLTRRIQFFMSSITCILSTFANTVNIFLVLEGDAKTYDTIQAVKHEYGSDLNWLVPYPGDWHLLKNYQICIMKPFF